MNKTTRKQIGASEGFDCIVYTQTCDVIATPMCKCLYISGRAALYDGRSALHTWIRIWIWCHRRLPWNTAFASHVKCLWWSPSSACIYIPRLFHSPDCFTVSTLCAYTHLGSRGYFRVYRRSCFDVVCKKSAYQIEVIILQHPRSVTKWLVSMA